MENQILLIRQSKNHYKETIYIQDVRSIGHFLNGIELLYKSWLFNSKESTEFENQSLSEKKKLYNKEYRISVTRINKNSPLEVELVIKSLGLFIKLIDLFYSENQQEEYLKLEIGRLCDLNFNDEENEKLFQQILKYYNASKRLIKTLNLIIEIKNK